MKKVLFLSGGIIAVVLGAAVALGVFESREPAPNPDPNHTHADFAVWVAGTKLDFSDDRYMSSVPAEETAWSIIPAAHAHEEGEGEALPGRQYLHLHDGVGHVIHRHKPGLTLGDFFLSIGLDLHSDCFTVDDFLLSQVPEEERQTWNLTAELCNSGKFRWTMVVNGVLTPVNPAYVFEDGDQILLSYESSDTAWQQQWQDMTDDACLYSRTCPWRGDPPEENCIADPTVPCVIVE